MALWVAGHRFQERLQMLIDHAVQHTVLGGAWVIQGDVATHADEVRAEPEG